MDVRCLGHFSKSPFQLRAQSWTICWSQRSWTHHLEVDVGPVDLGAFGMTSNLRGIDEYKSGRTGRNGRGCDVMLENAYYWLSLKITTFSLIFSLSTRPSAHRIVLPKLHALLLPPFECPCCSFLSRGQPRTDVQVELLSPSVPLFVTFFSQSRIVAGVVGIQFIGTGIVRKSKDVLRICHDGQLLWTSMAASAVGRDWELHCK